MCLSSQESWNTVAVFVPFLIYASDIAADVLDEFFIFFVIILSEDSCSTLQTKNDFLLVISQKDYSSDAR